MSDPPESIVVKRLVRCLRYRLTYERVFQDFLEPAPGRAVAELLHGLIDAQKTAAMSLSTYLKRQGVSVKDLPSNRRLLEHAARYLGIGPRLRFAHAGLARAVSWYRTQLLDRQMTDDPELRDMLFDLGQAEAAKLWRVEAVMDMLGAAVQPEAEKESRPPRNELQPTGIWRPRLVDKLERPVWSDKSPGQLPRPSSSGFSR